MDRMDAVPAALASGLLPPSPLQPDWANLLSSNTAKPRHLRKLIGLVCSWDVGLQSSLPTQSKWMELFMGRSNAVSATRAS